MKNILASIDIGSAYIKLVVCEIYKNKMNVLASTCVVSKGIKKGFVVDPQLARESLKKAFTDVEEMLGVPVNQTIVNIPIYDANFSVVEGYSTVTNKEKEIKGNDIVRALQASVYNKIDENYELVSVLPLEFDVDGKGGIKDPKGMIGDKISVKALMITAPKKNIFSFVSVLESIGVKSVDVVMGAISDYFEYKNSFTDTSVGAIINLGADTTSVAIFNKGVLVKGEVIALGAKTVDSDLSYIYKIDIPTSRDVKESFAAAHKKAAGEEELEVINKLNENIVISQFDASQIVMSRLEEIFNLAKKQISLLTNREISYIIITGGITEMPGIEYVVQDVFGKVGVVGKINTLGIRDNRFSRASGGVKSFYDKLLLRGKTFSMLDENKQKELVSARKRGLNWSNDSIIGKVFGYFFES